MTTVVTWSKRGNFIVDFLVWARKSDVDRYALATPVWQQRCQRHRSLTDLTDLRTYPTLLLQELLEPLSKLRCFATGGTSLLTSVLGKRTESGNQTRKTANCTLLACSAKVLVFATLRLKIDWVSGKLAVLCADGSDKARNDYGVCAAWPSRGGKNWIVWSQR